ncbi:hypothetical protein KFK09_024943 [Dendrobium nobile]|uniref:PHD-type zinc finger plants domain-containing protein n=1 Tax=Dendrobium nobile TaxID=94219 RepID=A0A8T3AF61_DENNO|nr:hypothetical protein KFK09_024943 [Dendrobium nobile]
MGSSGGGQAVPPPPSVVCCMCGDRGLSIELFRCKVCLFRSQHKYCSDLYPKTETYKACNWCLREERGKAVARDQLATTSENSSSPSGNGSGSLGWKLQRGAPPLQLSKPVKKQRVPERAATSSEKMTTEQELSPGTGRVRQTFRGKVRRYKLLEEVSS